MKNNTFDFRRFWQTLKWTVLTERKSILTAAVAFLVAFLAIQLFSCFTIFDLTQTLGREATWGGMITCLGLFAFMQGYYASGVLGNARQSRQRTTVLMLPASNAEKFTARLVYCLLFMPALLLVTLLGASALRMLLELLAGHQDIVLGFGLMQNYFELNFTGWMPHAASLWSLSLFILGGVFFRQRPFVWTNVALFAGSLLLFTLLFYVGTLIGEDNIKQLFRGLDGMSFDTFELIVNLVLTAFTVFNVWLSYWLFCRLEVVQHKWFNV